MAKPKFTAPAHTPFAHRVRRALEFAELDATEVAAALEKILPAKSTGRPWTVKPQIIQYIAQKAHNSQLTPYLARVCGVDPDWLRDDSGPAPGTEGPKALPAPKAPSLLTESKREQIGSRLFAEIKRCRQPAADVAARLNMTLPEFQERAKHGDFSLEDLAEIVLFLGNGATLDFIVLGRFPIGDGVGPAGEIISSIKARAKSPRRS